MTCLWAVSRAPGTYPPASAPASRAIRRLSVAGAPAGPAAPAAPAGPAGPASSTFSNRKSSADTGCLGAGVPVGAGAGRGLSVPWGRIAPGAPSSQGAAVKSHVPDTARSSTIVVAKAGTNPHRLGEKILCQAGAFLSGSERSSIMPSILSHRPAGARSLADSASK